MAFVERENQHPVDDVDGKFGTCMAIRWIMYGSTMPSTVHSRIIRVSFMYIH